MLAISTPSDEGEMNFYTSMMGTKDPNDPSKLMFKVLKISLACPACTEAGRASECTHMEKFRPPWKVSFLFVVSRYFQILLTRILFQIPAVRKQISNGKTNL
jgi:hypothetical protein